MEIIVGIILVLIMAACLYSIIKYQISDKKCIKTDIMDNKEIFIEEAANDFVETFRRKCTAEERNRFDPQPALEVPELTDDNIRDIIKEFFAKETLTEALDYFYDVLKDYVENTYDQIDWNNGMSRDERAEKEPAYIQWGRFMDIKDIWSFTYHNLRLSDMWVDVHGKRHTDEEAAKIAADKWCELIFGWHLQDNGAINEDHGGGFYACALGTVLANNAKEGLTEDVKVNAHKLFYEYYLHSIRFRNNPDLDGEDLQWLVENLKNDPEDNRPWDWNRYGFCYDLYCDYGPDIAIYLILYNAGVPKKSIGSICPWKTGITIRAEDNAIFYNTYQHREEIG